MQPVLVVSAWTILPEVYVKQAIVDCLADTSGRHHAMLSTLLTLHFPVFK